jgi:glutathione S-transferase
VLIPLTAPDFAVGLLSLTGTAVRDEHLRRSQFRQLPESEVGQRPARIALHTWISIDTLKRETHTPEFLRLNGAGQVPVIELDDGRALAQSNAIIRYLARDSDLIPLDSYAAAKMDEWLFWEQYSHEPYIAVCRFQMVYLHKPVSALDADKVRRGYAALDRMEQQLSTTRFLIGDHICLADVALLAYTRLAHQGGFDLDGHAAVRRWIGEAEASLGLAPVR